MTNTTTRAADKAADATAGKTASKTTSKAKAPRKRAATRSTGKSAAKSGSKSDGGSTRRTLLYERVADDLRAQITSGRLSPGTLLPTEPQLEQRYGVSRITARAAISVLRAEGLITVVHGKGAFVRRSNATDRPAHTHTRAVRDGGNGYADADTDDGWWPVEEPSTYQTETTPALALSLGVVEHTPLFATDRLLENNAGRRILRRTYLPMTTVEEAADTAPELEQDPYVDGGRLYTLLTKAGHRLTWTEYVTARNPAPDDTNTLRVPDGTPIITTRRITHGNNRRPLALEETHRSADDTQLAYTLTATTATTATTGGKPTAT